MGYDVHITRDAEWVDSEQAPIALREWLELLHGDAEMRLEGHADALLEDGRTLRYENEGLAVWVAYSGHGRDGNMAWFDYHDGRVAVKNPDEEILGKMVRIARALSARVIGDDGEAYGEGPGGDLIPAVAESQPWWKRVFSRRR